MDLRQLRYFVALVNERNFTRAAERLNIAQPPLSRQIQQLEAEFGAELVERDSRPLSITPIGRLLYEQSVQILSRVDEMRRMVFRAADSRKKHFAIGFVASTIYARLPALIRQFRIDAPDVELSLIEMGSIDQITALKEGMIDVGYGRIRFDDPAVRRTILREERLVAAVSISHPLANMTEPVSLSRLVNEPLILFPREPRPSYADQVLSLFRDNGLLPLVTHEVRELQIAVGMVAAGEGISVVPESIRQSRTDDVRYLEICEHAVSPIIMSHRINDFSPELVLMSRVIGKTYREWGYQIPEGIRELIGPDEAGLRADEFRLMGV